MNQKEKFFISLVIILSTTGVLLASFGLVDRYHDRYVKVKLAELEYESNEK